MGNFKWSILGRGSTYEISIIDVSIKYSYHDTFLQLSITKKKNKNRNGNWIHLILIFRITMWDKNRYHNVQIKLHLNYIFLGGSNHQNTCQGFNDRPLKPGLIILFLSQHISRRQTPESVNCIRLEKHKSLRCNTYWSDNFVLHSLQHNCTSSCHKDCYM